MFVISASWDTEIKMWNEKLWKYFLTRSKQYSNEFPYGEYFVFTQSENGSCICQSAFAPFEFFSGETEASVPRMLNLCCHWAPPSPGKLHKLAIQMIFSGWNRENLFCQI